MAVFNPCFSSDFPVAETQTGANPRMELDDQAAMKIPS